MCITKHVHTCNAHTFLSHHNLIFWKNIINNPSKLKLKLNHFPENLEVLKADEIT